jgi:phosphatidylglycerophosphatase A
VASVAGIGLTPRAPGTAGAAFAVAIFVLLSLLPRGLGAAVLGLLCAAGFAAGVWAAGVLGAATGRKDDGRIVMDEFVGQLVTLAPLLALPAWRLGADAAGLLPVVTGFVAFRVLDIWKPGPVGWAERRFSGGLGVMLDDLLAGLIGALALGAGMLAFAGGARA